MTSSREPGTLSVATLGNSATFAGEATNRMRQLRPEFAEPTYYPTIEDCWAALAAQQVDVIVLGAERTGQPHQGRAIIAGGNYVVGRLTQRLRCHLYVKTGARKNDIQTILGHGSVQQCRSFLDREFPQAALPQSHRNSVEAAEAVVAGDGSAAVVGSSSLIRLVHGLELLAADIDNGALCSWWAIANHRLVSAAPEELLITGRFNGDGAIGQLAAAIRERGFDLASVAAFPVDSGISVYDYILTFRGRGRLEDVETALKRFHNARCAGAFRDMN